MRCRHLGGQLIGFLVLCMVILYFYPFLSPTYKEKNAQSTPVPAPALQQNVEKINLPASKPHSHSRIIIDKPLNRSLATDPSVPANGQYDTSVNLSERIRWLSPEGQWGYTRGTPPSQWSNNTVLFNLRLDKLPKSKDSSVLKPLENYKNPCWMSNNKKLNCMPYFYLLGVTKSGTSAVWRELMKHPDALPGKTKELFFWGNIGAPLTSLVTAFDKTAPKIAKESVLLNNKTYHQKITGEGSPFCYSIQRAVSTIPKNMKNGEPIYTLPHTLYRLFNRTKLIVSLRDPTARLYSHYHHTVHTLRKTSVKPSEFHKLAERGVHYMTDCLTRQNRTLRSCVFDWTLRNKIHQQYQVMLHDSLYYPFAMEWLSVFPRNQILFIKAEEFYTDPSTVMTQVYKFLELSPVSDSLLQNISQTMTRHQLTISKQETDGKRYLSSLLPETRAMLDHFFRPFNDRLAQLLADDKWRFL